MALTFDNIAILIAVLLAVAYLIGSAFKGKRSCSKCPNTKVLKKDV